MPKNPVKSMRKRKSPESYRHGNLREAAIEIAVKLVKENGAQGWTMRDVAQAAGVTHVALYRHFESREALLSEVARIGFEKLVADAASHADQGLPAIGFVYISFAQDHPQLFEVMWSPAVLAFADAAFLASANRLLEMAKAAVYAVAKKGESQTDLHSRFLRAWAMVHGYAHLSSRGVLGHMGSELSQSGLKSWLVSVS